MSRLASDIGLQRTLVIEIRSPVPDGRILRAGGSRDDHESMSTSWMGALRERANLKPWDINTVDIVPKVRAPGEQVGAQYFSTMLT